MKLIDFGLSPYRKEWQRQKELQQAIIKHSTIGVKKEDALPETEEHLLVGEHFPVFTIGFHGDIDNLIANEEELEKRGCECIRIERGGDITFHGPGQVILYPLIDLHRHGLGVKEYVGLLEESVIRLLAQYGIKGERVDGATGVWIGKGTVEERKICAIGVKISRGVTMHGLALNVNTDLSFFRMINPCGFKSKGVTSMQNELSTHVDIAEVKEKLVRIFSELIEPASRY